MQHLAHLGIPYQALQHCGSVGLRDIQWAKLHPGVVQLGREEVYTYEQVVFQVGGQPPAQVPGKPRDQNRRLRSRLGLIHTRLPARRGGPPAGRRILALVPWKN